MRKSEIYNVILDKVCEVCEVKRDSVIQHKKFQAVVDARLIAVQYLRRTGLSSDDIALYSIRDLKGDATYCPPIDEIKKKAKVIDKLFNSYSSRCLESFAFCLMSKEVSEYCANAYREHYLSWMKKLPL